MNPIPTAAAGISMSRIHCNPVVAFCKKLIVARLDKNTSTRKDRNKMVANKKVIRQSVL
jgi:hypothetical protein